MCTSPLPQPDLSVVDQQQGSDRYFISFVSRVYSNLPAAYPGHVFVVWGEWDYENQVCTNYAYGVYGPSSTVAAVATGVVPSVFFGPYPATITDEDLNALNNPGDVANRTFNTALVVEVEEWTYDSSLGTMYKMDQSAQPYVLGSNDCVTFVQTIAQNIGLQLPDRGTFQTPQSYLTALVASATAEQHSGSFDGPMVGGYPAGWGTLSSPAGFTWVGAVHGLDLSGVGTYTTSDNTVMKGAFGPHGVPTGQCQFNFPDGSSFSGEFVNGAPNGQGAYNLPNGSSFSGNLVNGVPNGEGSFQLPDGSKFRGNLVNGVPSGGGGQYIWPDGSSFSGNMANGVPIGQGTYFYPNGSHVQGTWVNGTMQGQQGSPQINPILPAPVINFPIGGTPPGGTVTPGNLTQQLRLGGPLYRRPVFRKLGRLLKWAAYKRLV